MVKFLGVLVLVLLPLLLIAMAVGRRMEEAQERQDRDRAIKDGITALKRRIFNLETLRRAREERRR